MRKLGFIVTVFALACACSSQNTGVESEDTSSSKSTETDDTEVKDTETYADTGSEQSTSDSDSESETLVDTVSDSVTETEDSGTTLETDTLTDTDTNPPYDPKEGELHWLVPLYSPGEDSVQSLHVRQDGVIIAAGKSTVTLSSPNLNNPVWTRNCELVRPLYAIALNSDGTIQENSACLGSMTGPPENIFVVPVAHDWLWIGGTMMGETVIEAGLEQDWYWDGRGVFPIFASYKEQFETTWARSLIPRMDMARATAAMTDSNGKIYLTGSFSKPITLGEGEPNETFMSTKLESGSAFIAKYDEDASLLWAVHEKIGKSERIGVKTLQLTYVFSRRISYSWRGSYGLTLLGPGTT